MSEVKWSAELEVALFHSMHGHKPVGKYIMSIWSVSCLCSIDLRGSLLSCSDSYRYD